MSEAHQLTGPAYGEPLASGRVGARVVIPLSGAPSPRWSRMLTAHLAQDLTGHAAVGHLRMGTIVQGRQLVFEGVEDREAPALGRCLRGAVEAANRACEDDGAACEGNMPKETAEAIARELGEQLVSAPSR